MLIVSSKTPNQPAAPKALPTTKKGYNARRVPKAATAPALIATWVKVGGHGSGADADPMKGGVSHLS
jgi:hypothetical protein